MYRVTKTKDFRALIVLDELLFPNDEGIRNLENQIWFQCRKDGVLVAYASYQIEHQGTVANLTRAGVIKSERGRGLQVRMIEARIKDAKARGCKWVTTYTADWNYASANSLIKCGFKLYKAPKGEVDYEGYLHFRKRI